MGEILEKVVLKGIRWAWSKFDGKKTIIGIVMKCVAATLGGLRIIFPEIQAAVPNTVDEVIDDFGNAFVGGGIAHKVQKVKS